MIMTGNDLITIYDLLMLFNIDTKWKMLMVNNSENNLEWTRNNERNE